MTKALPDRELLRALFSLDAGTGTLRWRPRPVAWFSAPKYAATWNAKNAGRVAGADRGGGYRVVIIFRERYYAHRLIHWMLHGEDLAGMHIDHARGLSEGNTDKNLRAATPSQNLANRQRLNRNNTSGVAGVWWHTTGRRWVADIKVNSRKIRIGMFTTLADAAAARHAAERRYFGVFAPQPLSRKPYPKS